MTIISANSRETLAAAPRRGDKRAYVRHPMHGAPLTLRIGKKELVLRLKDLSCGGACGLLDEPVALGDYLIIELEKGAKAEAEVCWVRRVWVGLKFSRAVSPVLVTRLCERHAPVVDDAG